MIDYEWDYDEAQNNYNTDGYGADQDGQILIPTRWAYMMGSTFVVCIFLVGAAFYRARRSSRKRLQDLEQGVEGKKIRWWGQRFRSP